MSFNWSDPRKNSRIDVFMMAKTEASRMKRLASIKSTISNQAAGAPQRSKKRASGDAVRPSSRLHHRELEEDTRVGSGGNNQSFYTEFLPHASRQSVFDDIQVHAAADGLFHPDSSIQAFAEHDAKYQHTSESTAKPSSRKLTTASSKTSSHSQTRSPSLASSTTSLLPPLSRNNTFRDRLSSRSDSSLLTTASGSSKSTTASNSDLLAPRRAGIVPSSADRCSAELYEEDWDENLVAEGDDEDNPDDHPEMSGLCTKAPDARIHVDENNYAVSRDATELRRLLMKQSQADRGVPETQEEDADGIPILTGSKAVAASISSGVRILKHSKGGKKTKAVLSASTSAHTTDSHHPPAGPSKKSSHCTESPEATSDAQRDQQGTSVSAPPKREIRVRNGVSLADLKKEHRLALAMLVELGGPVDSHFSTDAHRQDHVQDPSKPKSRRGQSAGRSTMNPPSSTAAAAPRADASSAAIAPEHTSSATSLVSRLRSAVPSSSRASSPAAASPEDHAADSSMDMPSKQLAQVALDAARLVLEAPAPTTETERQAERVVGRERRPPEDGMDSEDENEQTAGSVDSQYQDDEFE